MAKITAEELQELFDIVQEIKPVRLSFCISQAERTLRKLLTNAVYDAETPASQVAGLQFAEAHYAVYHLLLNTSLRIRRSGLVKKEQESGASVQNNAAHEYYTPKEIGELRKEFLEAAETAALPFQPVATAKSKNTSVLMRGSWTN